MIAAALTAAAALLALCVQSALHQRALRAMAADANARVERAYDDVANRITAAAGVGHTSALQIEDARRMRAERQQDERPKLFRSRDSRAIVDDELVDLADMPGAMAALEHMELVGIQPE